MLLNSKPSAAYCNHGFEIDPTCSSVGVLQAAISFGLSESTPYEDPEDRNTSRVSTSVISGEKIFM
jgi:hypothetical protein